MLLIISLTLARKINYSLQDVTVDDTYPPAVRVLSDDDSSDNISKTTRDTIHHDKSDKVIEHHGYNFSLYEMQDPGFIITSAAYPDHVFTIFDVENFKRVILPVNLAPISVRNLKNQIFHGYYRKNDSGVWFEWERTKDPYMKLETEDNSDLERINVIASGLEMHATRKLVITDQLFIMDMVKGSPFFRIRSNGRCLTVADYKNHNRDAFPLLFMSCNEDLEQEFALVSVMKAVCKLGIENLCGRDEQMAITDAEQVLNKKLMSLISAAGTL